MPERNVFCGDVVETRLHDAKNTRPVLIYEEGLRIVSHRDTPARGDESHEDWRHRVDILGVDFYFYALRLDKNFKPKDKLGYGISLMTLKKKLYIWTALHEDFNHIGLQWPFEKLVNIPSPKQIKETYECLQTAS